MKSCPTCQQLHSDDLEVCPYDGTRLINSSSGYNPESPGGYKWQSGQTQQNYYQPQQPPPPPGWGYYPPPGGYPPPYGMPYPQSPGGEGLATAALWTGISTGACLIFGIVLMISAASTWASSYNSGYYTRRPGPAFAFGAILVFLSYIVGLTALILGIVATAMSNKNPSISKAKAIIGLCLGTIPFLLLIVGLISGASWGGYRRF